MSILLKLFLTFLKIGAVSFGGGYGMISLIREAVIENGWLTEADFLNFVAVSESTPGPIAVNMATFIGSSQAGVLGSLVATLGVITPSFIIILIIASLIRNFLKYGLVKALLSGIRPTVAALIIATSLTMILSLFFSIDTVRSKPFVSVFAILTFLLIAAIDIISKKLFKKKMPPIALILFSALIGLIAYSF